MADMNSPSHHQPIHFTNEGNRIAIQAGQYIVHGDSISQHAEGSLALLPQAADAPFNSYAKQHEPTCLHNTRTELLREIHNWADSPDGRCIFWLNGLAGTGKSTIARTVARSYLDKRRLAVSFFFARGGGDVGYAGKFVTSIAVQLAHNIPASRKHICNAVTERYDIAQQSLRDQWQHLVCRPLSVLKGPATYLLVVDALDECDNENNIQIIVRLLAETQSLVNARLRVLLTSRPEAPIRHGLYEIQNMKHQNFALHSISSSIVDRDIMLFLKTELQSVGRSWCRRDDWPDMEAIVQLVQTASGLFIWAATACRFIREGKRFAPRRLDMILCKSDNSAAGPESHLDQIYITVLKNSVNAGYTDLEREAQCSMLRYVLGSVVVLFSALSISSLSKLLQIADEGIEQVLEDLHSILHIPESLDQPLRLHHPSFREFLLDRKRCDDAFFEVDGKSTHEKLVFRCFELMSAPGGLRQDMCQLLKPGTRRRDISEGAISISLSPELQYACQYWIDHLEQSQIRIEDGDHTHLFLQKYLLNWFEAMSLLEQSNKCVILLTKLQNIVHLSASTIADFTYDARRFALRFQSVLADAPLQVYSSALTFAVEGSIIRQTFRPHLAQSMELISEKERSWDASRTTFEGHEGYINAVAFSPDAQLIASTSDDGTIRLWDTMTGLCQNVLEGHECEFSSITFSKDGRMIASGSDDGNIRLWLTATGSCCNILEDHCDAVSAIDFSPDGRFIASGGHDHDVLLYETNILHKYAEIFQGHTRLVDIVLFSPNSQMVASASYDNTIRLWDTSTTEPDEHTLIDHTGDIATIAFLSDGDIIVSTSMDDKMIRLWDTETGSCLRVFEGRPDFPCFISSDGQLFMSALGDDGMGLWETKSGSCRRPLTEPFKTAVQDASRAIFSPDQRLVLLVGHQLEVTFWDTTTGSLHGRLPGHGHNFPSTCFSHDGQLIVSITDYNKIRLWETNTPTSYSTPEGHSDYVRDVAFSPDGQLIASASGDKTLRIWKGATGLCWHTLNHSESVLKVIFSPSGDLVASVSGDDNVRLWNVATGSCCYALKGHCRQIDGIVFSPDGQLIASTSFGDEVRIWDISGEPRCIALEDDAGSSVTFSPDGQVFAICSSTNETVRIYNKITGSLQSHHEGSSVVAFSPDGKIVALAPHSNKVLLWMTETRLYRSALTCDEPIIPKGLEAIVFSSDSRFMASLALDGRSIKLWDVANCCSTHLEISHRVRVIAFSQDARLLQTDRGDIAISLPSDRNSSSQKEQRDTLFVEGEWILYNGEPLVWLPSEYRTQRSAVLKDIVCLGLASGRVVILRVTPGKTRLANAKPIRSRMGNKVVVLE